MELTGTALIVVVETHITAFGFANKFILFQQNWKQTKSARRLFGLYDTLTSLYSGTSLHTTHIIRTHTDESLSVLVMNQFEFFR
jgi:hypothetical protein